MREIKFRAFDTKNKRWLCGYEKLGGFDIMGECIIFGEWASQLGPIDQWNDIAVMQYTGLKDKNGKEIYEGDIVKTYMGNICSIEWGHVIESEFENEYEYTGFCFHHIQQNRNYHLDVTSSCSIIGNIHQNPELLTP